MTGGKTPHLALKGMLEIFLKIPPLVKILKFQKKTSNQKLNLQDELYRLGKR